MALVNGGVATGIDAKAIFAKIKDAKMRVGANYVRPGHYWLRMDAIKIDKNRKGNTFMAVEMTVVKVIGDIQNHRVGEAVCHMMMTANDCFLGNVKALIAHVMDMKPEEIGENECLLICSAEQPLTGMVVELQAKNITTKNGKDFTEVNYRREVPPAEAAASLPEDVQQLYFPNNALQRLAEKMAAAS